MSPRGWRETFDSTLRRLGKRHLSEADRDKLNEIGVRFLAGTRLDAAEVAWVEAEILRPEPPPPPAPPAPAPVTPEPARPTARQPEQLEPCPTCRGGMSTADHRRLCAATAPAGAPSTSRVTYGGVVAPDDEPGTWSPPFDDAAAEYAAQLAWLNLHPDETPPWADD